LRGAKLTISIHRFFETVDPFIYPVLSEGDFAEVVVDATDLCVPLLRPHQLLLRRGKVLATKSDCANRVVRKRHRLSDAGCQLVERCKGVGRLARLGHYQRTINGDLLVPRQRLRGSVQMTNRLFVLPGFEISAANHCAQPGADGCSSVELEHWVEF